MLSLTKGNREGLKKFYQLNKEVIYCYKDKIIVSMENTGYYL
jgi:hypothetical protein